MKKSLSVFFLIAFTVIIGFTVNADEVDTGNLVVHYHAWDGDYTNLGSHAWGDVAAPQETPDGTDDFGVYFEYDGVALGTEVGFIAVDWENGAQNWDAKKTQNVHIDKSVLVKDETVHVYVFEGADSPSGTDSPQYLVAKHDEYNMLLTYFDPSGSYEEKLGVHAWNGWSGYQTVDENGAWMSETLAASWGTPDKVFMEVGKAADGTAVIAAMLSTATAPTSEATPGLLIYAGLNDNKKTGDINAYTALGDSPVLGQAGAAWVVSKGDAYVAGDNVYTDDYNAFYEEAFRFRLVPFSLDGKVGTYASDPNSVIVKLSATIANPYPEAETDEEMEAAIAKVEGWFTLTEVTEVDDKGEAKTYGDTVTFERVDFALTNTTLQEFVIVLDDANALDNTKMYEIKFDLGLEDETNKSAALMVNMDTEAPVISFTSPSSIIGQDPEDRVIEIELGSEWNQSWFPRYGVTDNRDGDLTSFVYVPAGEYSTLNTGELGDYTIMLEVKDNWGNVSQETFIFRVVEGK